jgi:probable HAF family extracellular repeat protein
MRLSTILAVTLFALVAFFSSPSMLWASGLQSYAVADLGPPPMSFAVPEFPYIPRFDGTGGVTVSKVGYYSGPQISSADPQFASYQPNAAITTGTAGAYTAGWITSGGSMAAFLSNGTTAQTIGPIFASIASSSYADSAYGVNSLGQVVGNTLVGAGQIEAFSYTSGNKPLLLGTLGGLTSSATAVNDSGQIVGQSNTSDGQMHAFLFTNGTMLDLNKLLSGPSSWVLTNATDIDNTGHILVTASNAAGATHLLMLTPDPLPVPEPTTLGAWVLGASVSVWRMRRRAAASRG